MNELTILYKVPLYNVFIPHRYTCNIIPPYLLTGTAYYKTTKGQQSFYR